MRSPPEEVIQARRDDTRLVVLPRHQRKVAHHKHGSGLFLASLCQIATKQLTNLLSTR